MSEEEEIFREIIMEHYRNPNKGRSDGYSEDACCGVNKLCGDRIEVMVGSKDAEVSLSAKPEGCAISTASASIMMDLLNGKSVVTCRSWIEKITGFSKQEETIEFADVGEIAAIFHVLKQGNRIPCALLPWITLEGVLAGKKEVSIG